MRKRLESQLQLRLSSSLPGHIVKCVIDMDGLVMVNVDHPISGESWFISGITMQSLLGKGAMDRVALQIVGEVNSLRGDPPLLLTQEKTR